ncbi:hypothetical protein TWF173_003136 [Orbilia oligospora]|nr:hypothetical protein TWF173_003136 [Orbilia oligospora]
MTSLVNKRNSGIGNGKAEKLVLPASGQKPLRDSNKGYEESGGAEAYNKEKTTSIRSKKPSRHNVNLEQRCEAIWEGVEYGELSQNWDNLEQGQGGYEDIEKKTRSGQNFLHLLAEIMDIEPEPNEEDEFPQSWNGARPSGDGEQLVSRPAAEEPSKRQINFFEHVVVRWPQMLGELNKSSETPLYLLLVSCPLLTFHALNIWVPEENYRRKDKDPLGGCCACTYIQKPTSSTLNQTASASGCRQIRISPAMFEACKFTAAEVGDTGKTEAYGKGVYCLNTLDTEKLEARNQKIKLALQQGVGLALETRIAKHGPRTRNGTSKTPNPVADAFKFFAKMLDGPEYIFSIAGIDRGELTPPNLRTLKMLWKECQPGVFLESSDESKETLLYKAIKLYKTAHEQNFDSRFLCDFIEILIQTCPESIYAATPVPYGSTYGSSSPYNLLKSIEDKIRASVSLRSNSTSLDFRNSNSNSNLKRERMDPRNDSGPTVINGATKTIQGHHPTKGDIGRQSTQHYIAKTKNLIKTICIGGETSLDTGARRGAATQNLKGETEKTRLEKMAYLYGGVEEKQICLNLEEKTSRAIDVDYLEVLKQQDGEFESILEFVKLPGAPAREKGSDRELHKSSRTMKNSSNGDQYIKIFEWLKKEGVTKIFRVQVDEIGESLSFQTTPHSNFAIRSCLKPFDVEEFNWRKYDVCSETILEAAPNAKIVHLYSSGNTAVLRGWASPDAIDESYADFRLSVRQLSTLHISLDTLSDHDLADCTNYEQTLKDKMHEFLPSLAIDKIYFNYPTRGANFRATASTSYMRSSAVIYSPWISHLSNSQKFIRDSLGQLAQEDTIRQPEVKVAILDDGITYGFHNELRETDRNCIKGKTYKKDGQPWIRNDIKRNHGTEMAACVQAVCPMAKFFIKRLEDNRRERNKSFVRSATEAIKEAIAEQVDIISMSWSFSPSSVDPEAESEFSDQVASAIKKNIIIMVALPDIYDPSESRKRYPACLENVIIVGSAGKYGLSSPESRINDKNCYLFPGEDVRLGDSEEPISGTSVSTALAAGFAALMIHFAKVQSAYSEIQSGGMGDQRSSRGPGASQKITFLFKKCGYNEGGSQAYWVRLDSSFMKDCPRSLLDIDKMKEFLDVKCTQLFDYVGPWSTS